MKTYRCIILIVLLPVLTCCSSKIISLEKATKADKIITLHSPLPIQRSITKFGLTQRFIIKQDMIFASLEGYIMIFDTTGTLIRVISQEEFQF